MQFKLQLDRQHPKGDLNLKITVDARGEILELKNTINIMVAQLNSFAPEVAHVAREVGTDGKLGGQADVKGVGGTWKDLTDNVNRLAANLTTVSEEAEGARATLAPGDEVVLIIEDDPKFAAILRDTAHDKGFKGVIVASSEKALSLARQYVFSAITLDIRLPDIEGLPVRGDRGAVQGHCGGPVRLALAR